MRDSPCLTAEKGKAQDQEDNESWEPSLGQLKIPEALLAKAQAQSHRPTSCCGQPTIELRARSRSGPCAQNKGSLHSAQAACLEGIHYFLWPLLPKTKAGCSQQLGAEAGEGGEVINMSPDFCELPSNLLLRAVPRVFANKPNGLPRVHSKRLTAFSVKSWRRSASFTPGSPQWEGGAQGRHGAQLPISAFWRGLAPGALQYHLIQHL